MHRQLVQGSRTLMAIGASAALTATIATAADPVRPSDAQARYQQERAACDSGQSQQDRATCLREAGAALQKAGKVGSLTARPQYQQNELARCELFAAGGARRLPCADAGPRDDERQRRGGRNLP